MPSKIKPLQQLSPQHLLFCRMYIGEAAFNGTRSATLSGYSEKSARTQAQQLLRDPLIQKELATLARPALEKAELSIDSVMAELAAIVHTRLSDFFDKNGALIPLVDLPDGAQMAVKSFRVRQAPDGSALVDVQLNDKLKGIQLAMTKLGLLSDALHQGDDQPKIVMVGLDDYERGQRAVEGTNDITMVHLDPL